MNINGISKAINVVTTTADVVGTAKDIKDVKEGKKGVTGFEIILDVFAQAFKAVLWVVTNQVSLESKKDDYDNYYDPMTPGGFYDDIDYINK